MIKRISNPLLIFSLLLFLLSACAVKKMVKQAEQFEAAGMFGEAAELYYEALQKKPDKAELKIALKRNGQVYYEEQVAETRSSYNRQEYKETVYLYIQANQRIEKYQRQGVSIKTDPAMDRYFSDAKNYYLDQRYNSGLKLLGDEEFGEAKRIFTEISEIDANYKDTRNYLNQASFEPLYRQGNQHFQDGRYMDAYRQWENIFAQDKSYKDTRTRMEQALSERYKEGSLLLMHESFNDAATALGDVYQANPNFKDVKVLYTEARNEPVYRQAMVDLDKGRCRTAYFDFSRIIEDAVVYKKSKTLREQALKCAEYPVAVYSRPINHYTADALQFENTLIGSLVDQQNIFLKVFNLSTINSRMESSLVNSAGKMDSRLLQLLYDENGIKAVLYLDYDNYEKKSGELQKESKTGYERVVTKNDLGETKIYDRQVKYNEYSQENRIALSVAYKLVSTTTGEILLSNTYSDSRKDQISYATYGGNKDQLYPATFNRGVWNIDEQGYRRLQSLLREETQIKSLAQLQKYLFEELTNKIAVDINQFNPER